MNFLQLVDRLGGEVGASGTVTDVSTTTGEYLRLTRWINQAWLELQMEHADWLFLRNSATFSTIAADGDYDVTAAPISLTDFSGDFVNQSFRLYDDIGDEQYLTQLDYDEFRDTWLIGSNRTSQSRPQFITIAPDKKLLLAQIPDRVYTVVLDYYKVPSEMTVSNTAEPTGLPARFHMMLVYKAMEWYASYENAPEVATRGSFQYATMLDNLRITQLPSVTVELGFI